MVISSMNRLRRYQYDPLNRLIGLTRLERAATQRFYQINHLITELDEQTRRTLMRNGSQLLAQQQTDAAAKDTTLLVTDQGHSPLQAITQNGSRHFAYTAYGHHPTQGDLSYLPGFNGECADAITGHYLLGQGKRAFNPVLMRFNSPDELSPFGEGGMNGYIYCEGDPINAYDPTGNSPVRLFYATLPLTKKISTSRSIAKKLLKRSKAISRSKRPPTSPREIVRRSIADRSTQTIATPAQPGQIQPTALATYTTSPMSSPERRLSEFIDSLDKPQFPSQQVAVTERAGLQSKLSSLPTTRIADPSTTDMANALFGGSSTRGKASVQSMLEEQRKILGSQVPSLNSTNVRRFSVEDIAKKVRD